MIPTLLKGKRRWVVWRYETAGDRTTKVPYVATLGSPRKASTTNPDTWTSYAHAHIVAQRGDYAGIGFVLGDGIVGIDLDHAVDENGDPLPWARRIFELVPSFTERSPSQKGFHIYVAGELPGTRKRKGSVEAYDRARFFTVTGQHLHGTPRKVVPVDLRPFVKEFLLDPAPATQPQKARPVSEPNRVRSVEETLELLFTKNPKYRDLYAGRWQGLYASHSEADLALASALFNVSQDLELVDAIFRSSGLYRPKWDKRRGHKTYGQLTLERAMIK